ncbi:ABC transporter ATP-binding protein [Shinella sp. BYT-45]|uniref:ABC transporter ATP-binding protein n=1 Tax=Shinella sp. BYT-45 TaxID=3377377 RepID=UPI00398054FA
MASVTLSDVRKRFGDLETIHGVSIDIADGEFVTLVGPSGCGKSTLLRMIAGLEPVTSGSVSIGGKVVNDVAPRDRDIAMVFQSYALYPHMTVAENMGFSLKLRGLPKDEIDKAVRSAAAILSLEPLLARYPRALSGGQRQRVAMGRAIVRKPSVFLFDEPLSNLDAKLRVQMRQEIKDLHQRLGTTSIYVTHDQVEAMTMADKIVVLRNGRIEQVGRPLDLYDRPVNRFVAGFIGSPAMNFIQCKVLKGQFVAGDGTVLAPATDALEASGDIVFGIRPEHVDLDPAGIPARVLLVEPMGSETILSLEIAGERILASMRERTEVDVASTIHVSLRKEAWHVFDANGMRLG